jgi:hypothetical protein
MRSGSGMGKGSTRKIIAISVCLGFCVLAQAESQWSGPPSPGEQRLPGEPPPPFALEWGTLGSADGQFNFPTNAAVDLAGNAEPDKLVDNLVPQLARRTG